MESLLNLFTDACVFGERLPRHYRLRRRRVGHTFIAWVAWHGCSYPDCPTFAGQAYVGEHGTQRAEFSAAQHGLTAALSYIAITERESRPTKVVVHVDNDTVFRLMRGYWTPRDLKSHYEHTLSLCERLRQVGTLVEWESVSETHRVHKVAHSMSKQARHQVLRPEWRPADDPPAAAAA